MTNKVNKKTAPNIFFFQDFKSRRIIILLDSRNLTTHNQSLILKRVNNKFQSENQMIPEIHYGWTLPKIEEASLKPFSYSLLTQDVSFLADHYDILSKIFPYKPQS